MMCVCAQRELTRAASLCFNRLSLSLSAERIREYQPHHVGGQPAAGVGPLRLAADQADLRSAGAGVEGLRRGAG